MLPAKYSQLPYQGLRGRALFARFVSSLRMAFQLGGVEIDIPEISSSVATGLIVEMFRARVTAFAAGGNRLCPDSFAEFDNGDETVAARSVPFLGLSRGPRTERGERAPIAGREADWNARF